MESIDDDDAIAALVDIFNRPYWSRIWIIQELLLASVVQFWCGQLTISEPELRRYLYLTRNNLKPLCCEQLPWCGEQLYTP